MRRPFGWDYPPGVSGNEPEITGDWPDEDDEEPDDALSWDELADLYEKHRGGRRARTLPMNAVYIWAVRRTDLFRTDEEGYVYLKKE